MDNLISKFITDPSGFYAGWVNLLYGEVFKVTTNLSRFIKEERVKQGLNYAEISKMIGYTNLNKGMRRIIDLEREGIVHHEVLEKIIYALKLHKDKVKILIQQDEEVQQRKFDEWVKAPIKWHIIVRFIPAVYGEREIPSYIKTEDEAIEYAKSYAKENQKMLWLVLSRRENIHIGAYGEVMARYEVTRDFINLPYMEIR